MARKILTSFDGKITIEEVSVVTLLDKKKYQDNPVQRDHVKRAKAKKHMHGNMTLPQRLFSVAKLGKDFYFLDGHTRMEAIKIEKLNPVEKVFVVYYHVKSRQEVINLYYQFDSKDAVETPADTYLSAKKELGVELKSVLLKTSLKTVLGNAYQVVYGVSKAPSDAELLREFKNELEEIESWDIEKRKMPKGNQQGFGKIYGAGVRAAIIVSLRDNPEDWDDIADFWYDFFKCSLEDSCQSIINAYNASLNSERGSGQIALAKELQNYMREVVYE